MLNPHCLLCLKTRSCFNNFSIGFFYDLCYPSTHMVANVTPTLCSIFHKPFPRIWIQIQTPISFSTNHSFLHCTVHSLQWKCTCELFGHPHPGLNLWCVCYWVESMTTTPKVPSQWLGTVGESEWQWNHLSWFYNYISIDSYLMIYLVNIYKLGVPQFPPRSMKTRAEASKVKSLTSGSPSLNSLTAPSGWR